MKPYIIVYHKHFTMLDDLVNDYVAMGYQPVGGPFIGLNNELGQAMFRATIVKPKFTKEKKDE
jgi:hypothetical protein